MKRLISFLLIAVLVPAQAFGSVLIFRLTKQIDSDKPFDLATIDTAKYSKIRIAINYFANKTAKAKETKETKIEDFAASPLDELKKLETSEPDELSELNFISCYGVEGSELFNIGGCGLIDVPPGKIRIRAKGAGKYSIAVWAN